MFDWFLRCYFFVFNQKRIRLPRLDQDFKKFTQFHPIHEIWLTWSRSKSFSAPNTSYHIHMRNNAYRCDTEVPNLNRSNKKYTQYYVYMQSDAYTRNTVMKLQNEFFKWGWARFVHWNSSIAYICATRICTEYWSSTEQNAHSMYVRVFKITRTYRNKRPFRHHIITFIPKKFFEFQRIKCKENFPHRMTCNILTFVHTSIWFLKN